ncbi:MAG TPA: DUF2167 domain-containing protein [Myxococcales bacterium]|jgi:uncharacterized membrane-anchored protein|nr:DUF2167 domain-containing protein [Myxococcales bacterium]
MRRIFLLCLLSLTAAGARAADGEKPPKLDWKAGPVEVELGSLAKEKVPKGAIFANAADARKLMEHFGNRTDGSELGLIASDVEGQNWFIIFEKREVGFIKDDDKNNIDADAILKSITDATEESNEERKKNGEGPLHVKGWKIAPHYEQSTHHLVWAMLADSDGHEIVNYNIRMLGREGYVSATFVDSSSNFDQAAPRLKESLDGFTFSSGHSYAEWRPGDKVAQYGLTALVAAGAGAAAVKLGLFAMLAKVLAKAWKAVALGLGAVATWIRRFFKKKDARPDLQP